MKIQHQLVFRGYFCNFITRTYCFLVVTIEEINLVLDADKAKAYGVDRAPSLAIVGVHDGEARDSRIRFVGAPSGYEFISLVQAMLLVGGRPSQLSKESRARIEAVDQPITMQVFTTPT